MKRPAKPRQGWHTARSWSSGRFGCSLACMRSARPVSQAAWPATQKAASRQAARSRRAHGQDQARCRRSRRRSARPAGRASQRAAAASSASGAALLTARPRRRRLRRAARPGQQPPRLLGHRRAGVDEAHRVAGVAAQLVGDEGVVGAAQHQRVDLARRAAEAARSRAGSARTAPRSRRCRRARWRPPGRRRARSVKSACAGQRVVQRLELAAVQRAARGQHARRGRCGWRHRRLERRLDADHRQLGMLARAAGGWPPRWPCCRPPPAP